MAYQPTRLLLLCASIALFTACASSAPADNASEKSATRDCERTTGSNVCRRGSAGTPSPMTTISGEEVRRQGDLGPITSSRPKMPQN